MRLSKNQVTLAREVFETLAYESELDCSVRKARRILAGVGCTIEKSGSYVRLISPRTGSHTLNMRRGVRDVTDLMAHVTGFAEQQTHVRLKLSGNVAPTAPLARREDLNFTV